MKYLVLAIALLFSGAVFANNCRIDASVGEVVFKDSRHKVDDFCKDMYSKYGTDRGCYFREHQKKNSNRWEGNFRYERSFNNYWSYRDWADFRRGHSVTFTGDCKPDYY